MNYQVPVGFHLPSFQIPQVAAARTVPVQTVCHLSAHRYSLLWNLPSHCSMNPRVIEEKLKSFLSPTVREGVLENGGGGEE